MAVSACHDFTIHAAYCMRSAGAFYIIVVSLQMRIQSSYQVAEALRSSVQGLGDYDGIHDYASLWSWVSDEVVPTIYNYQDYENEDLNAWERNYLSEYNRYATFAHTVVSAALSAPLCTALDSIPSVGKQR